MEDFDFGKRNSLQNLQLQYFFFIFASETASSELASSELGVSQL